MQDNLKLAIIQSDLTWENPEQNLENFTSKIDSITGEPDLVVLPEMFSSGFTMTPQNVAESMDGKAVNWMIKMAAKTHAAICGSLVIKENNHYFNRFILAEPNGTTHSYDKRHTFTLAGEDKVYQAGTNKVIIHYKGWKICPLVCYDLRFPVWARNVEDYDLLIFVANWPKPRIVAWNTLLKARAIENMCYCAGVNRVGLDANNYAYSGHSAIYDGLGEKLTNLIEEQEGIDVVQLNKAHLSTIRSKLKFLDDKDHFSLQV